jgi:acetate kinase
VSGSTLLTFNAGSSTIKVGLFSTEADARRRIGTGIIDLRQAALSLNIREGQRITDVPLNVAATVDLREVIEATLGRLWHHFSLIDLAAIGHRVVHGGDRFTGPVVITRSVLAEIEALAPLAPLHQGQSVRLIRAISHLYPGLPQVASFDTAFHRSHSNLVRRFALPRALFDDGVKRYGFHGLSYSYIAAQLRQVAPNVAGGRVVVAHLGSGASLCALDAGISRDTTMGFSVLDGVPMATRCGSLDPGVLIYLMKERGLSVDAVEDMLYHHSGLLGVSGISADSRDLLKSEAPEARDALNLFTFKIARETAALTNTLGGLDGIVFTAGIGEHQPLIREAVCRHLGWLGVAIDLEANCRNDMRIDAVGSKVAVFVIPTDEEQVIADEACLVLKETKLER